MKKLSMAVVALCLVAGLAQAGRAGFNSKTILEATPAGRLIQAEGAAAVGATKQFESFGIKVAAKVEDGTRFMVMVMTPASQIPQMVGSLEMVLGVGSLRIIRQEMEAGRLDYEEYSHFAMITRIAAGASGLPFLPMRPTGAEDLAKVNPRYKTIIDPYTGAELVTVPALNPDVAIIHAQRADANGNAQIWGIIGEQKEVTFASKKVILTVEEIVDEAVIRSDPNRTLIPDFVVSAVCHVPFAAHPSYTQGYYDRDNKFYLDWDKISESREKVTAWLNEWVYGLKDHSEYWAKLGDETHDRLKVQAALSEPVNYGKY